KARDRRGAVLDVLVALVQPVLTALEEVCPGAGATDEAARIVANAEAGVHQANVVGSAHALAGEIDEDHVVGRRRTLAEADTAEAAVLDPRHGFTEVGGGRTTVVTDVVRRAVTIARAVAVGLVDAGRAAAEGL